MDNTETLAQAVTALQGIQTDDTDIQTQVANALSAVQAAQANQGAPVVDPNDAVVADIVQVLVAANLVTAVTPSTDIPVSDGTDTDQPASS